jgi:hypothetical protein
MPKNVEIVEMPKEEIIRRLETATDLKLGNIGGHKLCDFRPFFALAFADLLANYEFWGFCDIDIMFGNLCQLITEQFLDFSDGFTAHESQFAGHFTILRNTSAINESGFRIPQWRELCCDPTTRLMEEYAFSEAVSQISSLRIIRPLPLAQELQQPFARVGVTFDFSGNIAYLQNTQAVIVKWETGRTHLIEARSDSEEILYLHFMGLKQWWHWMFYDNNRLENRAHIFSRIGYGAVSHPAELDCARLYALYLCQKAALRAKSTVGRLLRRNLSTSTFLKVRRTIFGRTR